MGNMWQLQNLNPELPEWGSGGWGAEDALCPLCPTSHAHLMEEEVEALRDEVTRPCSNSKDVT